MNRFVYLKKIVAPAETVMLDTERGTFNVVPQGARQVQGNYMVLHQQEVSIFAADKNLYLQWDNNRWNYEELAEKLKYEHDFQNRMATFSVGNKAIQYDAWWADDPTFEPNLPERDEDEDFFAYVARLAHDDQLRQVLIQSWDK